jgi:RNA polymerase sigma factor (TIGR02999 family)
MAYDGSKNVTVQLNAWMDGDLLAGDDVVGLIYEELCLIARSQLKKERSHHTFKTQGLVHEAYLRLCEQRGLAFQSRAHFFGIAARTMRQILIDHARVNLAEKRGGRFDRVFIENIETVTREDTIDILKLNEALEDLEKHDVGKARMVEMRYFGGLTIEECAEVLSVSPATLKREWKFAKAWLLRHMQT